MKWALLILITFPFVLAQGQSGATKESQSQDIEAADWLDIFVEHEPELSLSLQVRSDGTISMPLVSDIHAEGLSPEELGHQICERLRQYVPDPHVRATVVGYPSQIHMPTYKDFKPKLPEILPDSWPSA